jgi:F-type H+-transporting ATPase subunit a
MYLCTKFTNAEIQFLNMLILKRPLRFIIVAFFAFIPLFSFGNIVSDSSRVTEAHSAAIEEVAHSTNGSKETKNLSKEDQAAEERAEFIQHHLKDSHDFHLFSYGKESGHEKHIGFPLPVILWDNGLQVFSSSKFHHGEAVAESNGNYYKINHHDGMIYKTDASGVESTVKPLDLSITKNVFMIIVVSLLMLLLFRNLGKSYKKNGGIATGVGRFFEPIILYIRDDIAIPNIGEKHYKKYMSHLLTVFFFIWFLNMFGLSPLGVNVTGNIAITAALAIITYLITTISGNKNYWGHIFWMPGVPAPMKLVLAPIEFLGTIIKPFSLMIRLYANMLAGHVVLMSIIALMYNFNSAVGSPLSFVLAFVLSILEVLVALLQAYIFTMLTALYFGAAVEEHHHDEAHH